ncbi:hypothetical protein MESS4_310086 [Mesorhizobium sp. STM 4661]|nr:hypothetical protein MESS4_310086 [Mesorhizobium sp. STM 4661]
MPSTTVGTANRTRRHVALLPHHQAAPMFMSLPYRAAGVVAAGWTPVRQPSSVWELAYWVK